MQKAISKSTILDYDGSGIITVAANAFGNIDSDNDISLPGSFVKTIKENFSRLRWLKDHDRDKLLGVQLSASETPEYLKMRGQINLKKELGRDTYADYVLMAENGLSLEHSVGVEPIQYEIDKDMGVRRVKEWKMWEWSTLSAWGANDQAKTLEIKGMGALDYIQQINILELKMRKGKYTNETFIKMEHHLSCLKSLLIEGAKPDPLLQPVPADVLADVTQKFLNSLKTN